MKDKLIISSVFASILAMSALFAYSPGAQAHEGFRYRGGCCYSNNWVAPALIGGIVGYELSRPRYYEPAPVIVQQQPVYVQQPQPYVQQPPYGYHWQEMFDPQTGVRKIVAVPN
jgi:hypothetical protein